MKAKIMKSAIAVFMVLIVASLWMKGLVTGEKQVATNRSAYGAGKLSNLERAYKGWEANYQANGGNESVSIALGWSKAMSFKFTTASGTAKIDLNSGLLSVEVAGLSPDDISDVWLIDNLPGDKHSVLPEPGDRMVCVGSLKSSGDIAGLQTTLDRSTFSDFRVDLVVVARQGKDPGKNGILFGSPNLFQRVYHSPGHGEIGVTLYPDGSSAVASVNPGLGLRLFDALFASPLVASPLAVAPLDFAALVEEGRDLFVNEQFNGNGRVCASCHPIENNFTIDPGFIATLPANDGLFAAEFNDSLNSDLNGGRRFENPVLMRQFGLITENLDGFSDLANRFVLRGVPHTLALRTSLTPGNDGTTTPPNQRTGWSGDGAPGGGTLRDFATGAVTQHFPLTLKRQPGVDFRLPTESELDALEAFQLSLGRQEELDLTTMAFPDPDVTAGKELFNGDAKCFNCHVNAGATPFDAPGENQNFNTGAEDFPNPAAVTGEVIPRDGGFGQAPDGQGGFGDGTFNTATLVEAGDTPPFFHNNIADDLRPAVEFYNSDAFNNSPAALEIGGIDMSDTEAFQVTAFLYVLNVLENIRVTSDLLEEAGTPSFPPPFPPQPPDLGRMNELLTLAVAENEDAVESMEDAEVQPDVLEDLEAVQATIESALNSGNIFVKISLINSALAQYATIKDRLVVIVSDELVVHYRTGDSQSNDNSNQPRFIIFNTGSSSVAVNDLTIRYWYTIDGAQPQEFHCDFAQVGRQNVQGSFHAVTEPTSTADYYMEVSFTAGAGNIAAGSNSGEIHTRFNKTNWAPYNENNDYSYDPSLSFHEWDRVTLYQNGILVWGVEPGGISKQAIAQTAAISIPEQFALEQNYPNPFNPTTKIAYVMSEAGAVSLRVYDIQGRQIATLLDDEFHAKGQYTVTWNGRDSNGNRVASGMYFCRMTTGAFSKSIKMTLLK